jgi:hypothetical protein
VEPQPIAIQQEIEVGLVEEETGDPTQEGAENKTASPVSTEEAG